MKWRAKSYFAYKVLKFTNKYNLLSKGMHVLCTTSLIISYTNQVLLLALGGCLEEEKNRQKNGT